jgi:hypothetical protein
MAAITPLNTTAGRRPTAFDNHKQNGRPKITIPPSPTIVYYGSLALIFSTSTSDVVSQSV